MAGSTSSPRHQKLCWFLGGFFTQKPSTLNHNFSHSYSPLQSALGLKIGHKNRPKILLELARANRRLQAPKPLSFSIFFLTLALPWISEFLEEENGQNLAAFYEFFGPKTDPYL